MTTLGDLFELIIMKTTNTLVLPVDAMLTQSKGSC